MLSYKCWSTFIFLVSIPLATSANDKWRKQMFEQTESLMEAAQEAIDKDMTIKQQRQLQKALQTVVKKFQETEKYMEPGVFRSPRFRSMKTKYAISVDDLEDMVNNDKIFRKKMNDRVRDKLQNRFEAVIHQSQAVMIVVQDSDGKKKELSEITKRHQQAKRSLESLRRNKNT